MKTTDNILVLREAESTNSTLMHLAQTNPSLPQLYSVVAMYQTAGRGQRGSRWQVSPERSLTFSFLLRSTGIKASEHFAISELVAYGVLKTLASYLGDEEKALLSVKWPNDVYYKDYKLAGILIEHSITRGEVDYSVVGIGINLNEKEFPEELINPISLRQVTGKYYDLGEVHERLMKRFADMVDGLMLGNYGELHGRYMSHLYRKTGLHPYKDAGGRFWAEIKTVLPSGHLVLMTEQGEERTYAFKEVAFDADESRD